MLRRLALVLLLAAAVARAEKPLWVAVGPPSLLAPLAPLVESRRAQGFDTALVEGSDPTAKARFPRPPAYLLLVGDDEANAAGAAWRVAAEQLPLYRWRAVQRERFASDAPWGDADGDGAADVPVGRIPARTPEEVAAAVAKILAFERRAPAPDGFRIVAWGGAPGYGGAIDAAATGLLVATIRQHAPRWATPWLISADPSQPLCGWPPDQPRLFAEEMRKGAILGAGLAHGSEDGFFSMRHGKNSIWFGARELEQGFPGDDPAPPLVLLSCNCGAFDGKAPSIAERALFLRGGPVAVVAATTESHPLTNYYTGVALLKTLADGAGPRLGDLWLAAERRGFAEKEFLVEQMLKEAEGKLEAEIDTGKLRRDQRLMYALFGDPALRLPLPLKLEATAEKRDGAFRWKATRPEGATRLLVGFRPAKREPAPAVEGDEAAQRRAKFLAANAAEAFEPMAEIGEGAWEGVVEKPGRLRLVAVLRDGFAVAALELK